VEPKLVVVMVGALVMLLEVLLEAGYGLTRDLVSVGKTTKPKKSKIIHRLVI
jgi:hypothetical protein